MEIIAIKNLSKSFKKKKVLESISLSIKEKEIVGVIGPSACGKSVLMKILIGFLKPDSGQIEIIAKSRNPVGFSSQHNSIYDYLTVKQNLKYFTKLYNLPRSERKKRIPYVIKMLNLEGFEKTLVKNLSGGTKKRVDIACAILKNPDILILDEPFLGLDPKLVENLSRIILYLNKVGKTIIISSHRVNELSVICTKLFLIKNKKVSTIKKSQIKQAYL